MLEKKEWSKRRPGTLTALFAELPAGTMDVAIVPLLQRACSEVPGALRSGVEFWLFSGRISSTNSECAARDPKTRSAYLRYSLSRFVLLTHACPARRATQRSSRY